MSSTYRELFSLMGHACLTMAQDPRVSIADQSPRSADAEQHHMALKGDLLNELGAKLDELFCKATYNALSGSFIDGQHHLDDTEVGALSGTVDDYFVAPIHAAIGEWEANEAAGWNDTTADEYRSFWRG